jgi:membrane protein
MKVDRERVLRTLTFWLRPDFVLRVVNRFQRIAGFDRAIALASSALTALVPLLIFTSAILPRLGDDNAANDIIERYDLDGAAADTVKEAFSPSADVSTNIGIFGALFLILAVLSFTRTLQRLFEQTWELPPLSVRNSLNGLKWIAGLLVYSAITGTFRGLFDEGVEELAAGFILIPLAAAFFTWSAYMLSAKRIRWQDFVAFGVTAACLLAIYSVGAAIYVPRLFETYATRYGVIGVVFALISALFAAMLVIVGSAAVGREVHDEVGRIRRGERPSEDEVQRQWDEVIAQARERWAGAQEWAADQRERRRQRKEQRAAAKNGGVAAGGGGPPDGEQSASAEPASAGGGEPSAPGGERELGKGEPLSPS